MSDLDKPAVVAFGEREADIAAGLKAEVAEAMKPVLAIMSRAAGHGLLIQWDNIGPDVFGRYELRGLKLLKHY